jgi:heme exporter protein A
MIRIIAQDLTRQFGWRRLFENISFELASPCALAVTGPNGSGKSTLLKIIAGLLPQSSGKIDIFWNGRRLAPAEMKSVAAMVSSEMNLYLELSGIENLLFFDHVSGGNSARSQCQAVLTQIGLEGRGDDPVREYSTGMKMRLKYALVLLKQAPFLIIDEPSTNLDQAGREIIYSLMADQKKNGLLIYATNEDGELAFAEQKIILGR